MKPPKGEHKEKASYKFYQGILGRYSLLALSAFPSQEDITHYWYIIEPFNLLPASGTIGAWLNYRFSSRDAIDAYISKTAKSQTQKENEKVE